MVDLQATNRWAGKPIEAGDRMKRAIALALAMMGTPALAQTRESPPDLHGVWSAHFLTPLERPDGVTELVVPPDKAPDVVRLLTWTPSGVYDPDFELFVPDALLSVEGQLRSSWIVEPADGRLPLTQLGRFVQARAAGMGRGSFDHPEERPGQERCTWGFALPPLTAVNLIIPTRIVQTPDAIVFATEDVDGARIVDMTGRAPPAAVRSRTGYSAGRWEGETLVVETTHIAGGGAAGVLLKQGLILSEASRVVERFRLLSADELLYEFTIIDAALYAWPWRAEYVFGRRDDEVYEYACHEGNSAMASILTAARLGRQAPPQP
jgi:hypothetical protein